MSVSTISSKQVFTKDAPKEKVVEFIDKIVKEKIQKIIDKSCQEIFEYMNGYQPALSMKRENIADRGLWTAAKNYMLNVWDSEGLRLDEPDLKVTGIKAVMPSTPQIVREAMKETFKILMNGKEEHLHEYIDKFRKEFYGKPFSQIGMPRGVNNLEKYRSSATVYKDACPIHVRASLVYNKLIDDFKLHSEYEQIYSGDKVKFGYLKIPNPVKRECYRGDLNDLPREIGLNRYIDYEKQFEKTYLHPLNDIISVVGWSTEKKATLDEWF
jgi:DNA polymerase elongation subunit (family B)